MRASAIEFRLRMLIQIVIVVVGFWAPWLQILDSGKRISLLEWLALQLARFGLLHFACATPIVIVAGALVAALGMVFRIWGAAHLGYGTVHHVQMQAPAVVTSGPYRFVRNPLYLGGWFMMVAVSLLMPPTGALLTIVLIALFYVRLILGEEAYLEAKLGNPYRQYLRSVPRLIPQLRTTLPPAESKPRWLIAIVSELNAISIFVSLAILSWTYDQELMIKAIVIGFGLSLIVRALIVDKPSTRPV